MATPDDYDYSHIAEDCRRYDDFAIGIGSAGLCDIINCTGMLRTMDQVFVDLITVIPGEKMQIHCLPTGTANRSGSPPPRRFPFPQNPIRPVYFGG